MKKIRDWLYAKNPIIVGGVLALIVALPLGAWLIDQDPPWKVRQRQINDQLRQSTATKVSVVIHRERATQLIIPEGVTASSGGNGIILTGPPELVAELHYQAYNLSYRGALAIDDRKH